MNAGTFGMIFVLSSLAVMHLSAQTIYGTVTNNKRLPLPNTEISVSGGCFLMGHCISGPDGRFRVDSLKRGHYTVTFRCEGYETTKFLDIELRRDRKLDVMLDPGITDGVPKIICPGCEPLLDKYGTGNQVHSWQIKGTNR